MFKSRTAEEEFDYLIAEDGSLELAWRRMLSSTILDSKDRLGLKIFSAATSQHISRLRDELKANKYEPQQAWFMYGPKDNGRLRVRSFLDMRDRIVFQAIGNVIIENCYSDLAKYANKTIFAHIPSPPNWDGKPSDFTFLPAFGKNNLRGSYYKGQYSKFIDRVYRDILDASAQEDMWVLETDIVSFYPSIDHNLLREMLIRRGWLKNETIIDLLMKCLAKWSVIEGSSASGQGVPVGFETSEILATLFLLDIDMDFSPADVTIRRFVDDTYVIAKEKKTIQRFLVNYDLALQKRSLTLNSSKTKMQPCGSDGLDEIEFKRDVHKKLSFIKNILEPQYEELTQEELLKMLFELISDKYTWYCDEKDIELIRENSRLIAFALYRLTAKLDLLKSVALCMLDEVPSKSLHVTTYLSQFENDDEVINKLFHTIEHPDQYSTVLIDCANALCILLGGIDERLEHILKDWIVSHKDWYVRDAAIDILSDHQYTAGFLWNNSLSDQSYLIRAKALFRCYDQTTKDKQKIAIIYRAFQDSHLTIKALGAYLYRRDAHLTIDKSRVPTDFRNFLFSDKALSSLTLFQRSVEEIFGFEIELALPFIGYLSPNISAVNQYLLNIKDTASDPLEYVKGLHGFTLYFLSAIVQVQQPDFSTGSLGDVLEHIHTDGEEYISVSRLRDTYEHAQKPNGKTIAYRTKENLFMGIKHIIALNLASQYRDCEMEVPTCIATHNQSNPLIKKETKMDNAQLTIALSFLIEVGKLTMDALRQRWKLQGKQKNTDLEVDLDGEEMNTEKATLLLNMAQRELGDKYDTIIYNLNKNREILEDIKIRRRGLMADEIRGNKDTGQIEILKNDLDKRTRYILKEIQDDLNQLGKVKIEQIPNSPT